MSTFTGKHTRIQYDPGCCGDIRIQDKRTERMLEPYGQDILDFANEQWNRKLIETLEKSHEHGQYIPNPSDARHKEIMDTLKEIRDAVTSTPDVTTAPAGAQCVCNLYGKAQIDGGYTCPVHGLQK